MRRRLGALILVGVLSTNGWASVVNSSPSEFTLKQSVEVQGAAANAYRLFTASVGSWWDPEHTYSARSSNLSFEARANGCFCEKLGPDASIAHMTVIYADPGKILRLTGGLGPLQQMALTGVMTVVFTASGERTKVDITYAVGGQASQNLDKLAPLVDQVLTGQWTRFARFVNTGKP
jgi:hypothetical protein